MNNDIEGLENKIQKLSSEYHNEIYNTMDTKGSWVKSNELLNNIINHAISLREMKMTRAKRQLDKAFTPRLKTMLAKSLEKE